MKRWELEAKFQLLEVGWRLRIPFFYKICVYSGMLKRNMANKGCCFIVGAHTRMLRV